MSKSVKSLKHFAPLKPILGNGTLSYYKKKKQIKKKKQECIMWVLNNCPAKSLHKFKFPYLVQEENSCRKTTLSNTQEDIKMELFMISSNTKWFIKKFIWHTSNGEFFNCSTLQNNE